MRLENKEFDLYFEANGVGFALKRDSRGKWASLASRVRNVPECLIRMLSPE